VLRREQYFEKVENKAASGLDLSKKAAVTSERSEITLGAHTVNSISVLQAHAAQKLLHQRSLSCCVAIKRSAIQVNHTRGIYGQGSSRGRSANQSKLTNVGSEHFEVL
jgi:hypothetical protein